MARMPERLSLDDLPEPPAPHRAVGRVIPQPYRHRSLPLRRAFLRRSLDVLQRLLDVLGGLLDGDLRRLGCLLELGVGDVAGSAVGGPRPPPTPSYRPWS